MIIKEKIFTFAVTGAEKFSSRNRRIVGKIKAREHCPQVGQIQAAQIRVFSHIAVVIPKAQQLRAEAVGKHQHRHKRQQQRHELIKTGQAQHGVCNATV